MEKVRYQSTGIERGGWNATSTILEFGTDKGSVEIVMPLATTAETVFDIQSLLGEAYSDVGSPMVPAGAEAARPARRVEVLRDAAGDHVLLFTLADGTSSAIKIDRRMVADAIKALSAP